jgi:hypothetical protein
MRGWVLLLAIATLLSAEGSAALPPPNPQQPVSFRETEWGALPPNFHSRRDGNRVFYARSLKQARKGAFRFTSIGLPYNPVDIDFKKYGVLGVFYKGHSAGFDPEAQSVEESAAGNLSAKITLECYNATYCAAPPRVPAQPWGIYVLLVIDKRSLVAPVKTLSVTTAFGTAPPLPDLAPPKPPTLLTVSQQNRHPSATFSAPGADDATIYFASKPDRARDGGFLRKNIKTLDLLGTIEIRRGSWSFEHPLDPGTYYVMMDAADYDCIGQPGCIGGYSNMLALTIAKPRPTYRVAVEVLHYVHIVHLTLRVTPLGESSSYKVCWQLKTNKRRCVSGRVAGHSWNSSAESRVSVPLRGMKARTKFTWYVRGHAVAAKTANTVRP